MRYCMFICSDEIYIPAERWIQHCEQRFTKKSDDPNICTTLAKNWTGKWATDMWNMIWSFCLILVKKLLKFGKSCHKN